DSLGSLVTRWRRQRRIGRWSNRPRLTLREANTRGRGCGSRTCSSRSLRSDSAVHAEPAVVAAELFRQQRLRTQQLRLPGEKGREIHREVFLLDAGRRDGTRRLPVSAPAAQQPDVHTTRLEGEQL